MKKEEFYSSTLNKKKSTVVNKSGNYISYFDITRTAENTMSVYNNLVSVGQNIKKRKGDYNVRGSFTQEPLIEDDLKMVSHLQCLLMFFGFVLTLIYHLKTETLQ